MNAKRFLLLLTGGWLAIFSFASAAEWQWSVPVGEGRAFLWVPPECRQVRAVVLAQHNMLEEGLLEHATFRTELARLGTAEVWIAPPLDPVFRFDRGAAERFDTLLRALADESGYSELAEAPVVPIGHSACASFPWNFAACNPARTLAVVSLKGDAPLTPLTGSGRPNPDWSRRTIDGIPGLMIMGEYEWSDDRLSPVLEYVKQHPGSPIALLAEPGRGHFDCSDGLVDFIALFLRKAAEARLPATPSQRGPVVLRPVDPVQGWLVERWCLNQPRRFPPAAVSEYTGDPADAFWCFDEEMARATHGYRAAQIGRRPQLLGFVQQGATVPQRDTHNQVTLAFLPEADELTFRLGTAFLDHVESGSANLTRWTQLPVGSSLGHAAAGGPIVLSRINGPVTQVAPDAFEVRLNRTWSTRDKRNRDIWLLAEHAGDADYRSAVQQALLRLPENHEGVVQQIQFSYIPDQRVGASSLKLEASSSAGLPVRFYVREGPAEIENDTLRFTALPPRAKLPLKITVVAWQLGRSAAPRVRIAEAVERTFFLQTAP